MADVSHSSLESDGVWEKMFQILLEFRFKHGHWLVPNPFPCDPDLGKWVARQRQNYLDIQSGKSRVLTSLTLERERKLDQVGFQWSRLLHTVKEPIDSKHSLSRKETDMSSDCDLVENDAHRRNTLPKSHVEHIAGRRNESSSFVGNARSVNLPFFAKDDTFMSNWVRNKCFHSIFKHRQHRILMERLSAQLHWNSASAQSPSCAVATKQNNSKLNGCSMENASKKRKSIDNKSEHLSKDKNGVGLAVRLHIKRPKRVRIDPIPTSNSPVLD